MQSLASSQDDVQHVYCSICIGVDVETCSTVSTLQGQCGSLLCSSHAISVEYVTAFGDQKCQDLLKYRGAERWACCSRFIFGSGGGYDYI